jgi:hypothetical protein
MIALAHGAIMHDPVARHGAIITSGSKTLMDANYIIPETW